MPRPAPGRVKLHRAAGLVPFTEAARRLGVHTATLRRWIAAGRIAVAVRDGGVAYLSTSEVEAHTPARRTP